MSAPLQRMEPRERLVIRSGRLVWIEKWREDDLKPFITVLVLNDEVVLTVNDAKNRASDIVTAKGLEKAFERIDKNVVPQVMQVAYIELAKLNDWAVENFETRIRRWGFLGFQVSFE